MPGSGLVMGVDFGTDSARVILVDARSGAVVGKGVSNFRRWADKLYCDAATSRFRQHPLDYLESLEAAARLAFAEAGKGSGRLLRGVCVDATGSSPAPVDGNGRPLALSPEFSDNPNAMFFLWKDHTATAEAAEFNARAAAWRGENYLRYQGLYSSEWFWAKMLKTVREDRPVREAAWNWIEECEWLTAELCGAGARFARSACAAGHKALWHTSFGGLPSREFLTGLDDYLGLIHDRYTAPVASDSPAGTLCERWREKWGADERVVVCGGIIDAHAGAIGCGIRPGMLVKIIGTSAVDMLVEREDNILPGDTMHLFGMAQNSIVPGYVGIEAGQAAFGDVFRWLENILCWRGGEGEKADGNVLAALNDACVRRPPPKLVALDWFNGRRYPNGDDGLKAGMVNLTLGVDAPELYQALVVGVTFGTKRMLDGYLASGISVKEIICAGGVARKSSYAMQVMADILERDVSISASDEACAKGAAMFAARAAGLHPSLAAAQEALGDGIVRKYQAGSAYRDEYAKLYAEYLALGRFVESAAGSGGVRTL